MHTKWNERHKRKPPCKHINSDSPAFQQADRRIWRSATVRRLAFVYFFIFYLNVCITSSRSLCVFFQCSDIIKKTTVVSLLKPLFYLDFSEN